jgi:hypothetical protein
VTAHAPSIKAYRAGARRLRHHFRDDPAAKLAALRALSIARDRTERGRIAVARVATSNCVEEFTDRVTCELLPGGPLRYSRRLALLNRARRLGINRFDANLMIAAVQNRAPRQRSAAPLRHSRLMLPLFAFALIQSAIVAGAWLALAR